MAVEEGRFHWIRNNQKKLRSDLYNGLMDAISKDDVNAQHLEKSTLFPSSHTSSPRYHVQNYQDAMAIFRCYGYPDIFLTFTSNPKWPKIQYLQNPIRQSDQEIIYTIEFQKRGLPHAHILVFLHSQYKNPLVSKIHEIVSAEIPNKETDGVAFSVVENHMIHGLCGDVNKNSPCMERGRCKKHFPKKFVNETYVDDNGYPMYRRRNNGAFVQKKVVSPRDLWRENAESLSEDIPYILKQKMWMIELRCTEEQIHNYALFEIDELMKKGGKSLADFPRMLIPDCSIF
ncbi:uncharacterized protein LOC116129381 [Pistacia vera]|uniref:uncharacterized protein LOC116129381 n=1 Tax=Pistacia vera TaxID=55513 RepID=UPI0012633B83|nr:uncharacterized protein LOC116129381 [Pistacia vera]